MTQPLGNTWDIRVDSLGPQNLRSERWLTVARDEAAIGCVGVLTVATRGPAGPGEVLVKIRGGSETYLAWSDTPVEKGATVLVIDSRGARTVDVIEWAGSADAPGDDAS